MMSIFAKAQWRKAAAKLSDIGMKEGGCKELTEYSQIEHLVASQLAQTVQIDAYVKAMKKGHQAPELVLKYLVIIHTHIRETQNVQENKLIEFMNHLLDKCEEMRYKFSQITEKKDNFYLNKTMGAKSSSSTADETFASKQVLLINGVIKPYISFLLKLLSISHEYKQVKARAGALQDHQAWMLINLLKMIAGITSHFTMIGRYFIRQYGHLVVLVTRALASDVHTSIAQLKRHTACQYKTLLALFSAVKTTQGCLQSYISMMQEMSKLNESLIEMYLGKYFFKYVLDLPEPIWFNTTSKQYSQIYALWKKTNEAVPNQSSTAFVRNKKRSLSLNLVSSKKLPSRVKDDSPFSYLF